MNSFSDKRDYYRMMLNSEVEVTVIDDEVNHQISATCRDLSATGMAIEVEHPLAMGTHVRVKLESSGNQVQALDVSGKVVRIDEESKESYLIGIFIEEID